MKIDLITGSLEVSGIEVSAKMNLNVFSSFFNAAIESGKNEDWVTYMLSINNEKVRFKINFIFKESNLSQIIFSIFDDQESWATWSEDKEIENLKKIDYILKQSLGDPPYTFQWGKAFSMFDQRSGASVGVLVYN